MRYGTTVMCVNPVRLVTEPVEMAMLTLALSWTRPGETPVIVTGPLASRGDPLGGGVPPLDTVATGELLLMFQ